MSEPPAKRARRTDSAAMWDDSNDRSAKDTSSSGPRSRRPADRGNKSEEGHKDAKSGLSTASKGDDNKRRRSRSPKHDRDRDRHERKRSRSPKDGNRNYRDRDSGHTRSDRKRPRSRSRSRSPHRNGVAVGISSSAGSGSSKSQPAGRKSESKSSLPNGGPRSVKQEDVGGDMEVDDGDGMDTMLKSVMGFSSFKSTQNTKVPGNQIYGVRKEKKSEYRQYMNRTGGFNRPLSPGR